LPWKLGAGDIEVHSGLMADQFKDAFGNLRLPQSVQMVRELQIQQEWPRALAHLGIMQTDVSN